MFFREKQVYLILRELHKWEQDDAVRNATENLVHMLIADETAVDNYEEIELEAQEGLRGENDAMGQILST
jgi:hypothetical protein